MNYIEIFKSGGIHIKKKNRGRFTDFCGGTVTEECIQRGKHSKNPLTRKRATFAANARRWKHSFGGSLKFYQSTDANNIGQTEEGDYETPAPIHIREYNYIPNEFDVSLMFPSMYNSSILQRAKEVTVPVSSYSSTKTTSSYSPWGTFKNVSYKGRTSDELNTIVQMFADAGIGIRVTSGYRANAKTKQGHVSHHSTGNAIDIVPTDGDFSQLEIKLSKHPEIINYMRQHGLGILRETTPDAMRRTGATGKHWHIGPDRSALADLDRLIQSWNV